jgi:hypothetical protein
VEVERRTYQPCESFTKEFLLQNSTSISVTVTLGSSAINLPAGWTYSTDITETVLLPYQSITVTVTITPPCNAGTALAITQPLAAGGADEPAMLNFEGYANGELLGGIQIQLAGPDRRIYLPMVIRQN